VGRTRFECKGSAVGSVVAKVGAVAMDNHNDVHHIKLVF